MAFNNEAPFQVRKHIQLLNGVNKPAALGGNVVLTLSDSTYQVLDAGASNRDIELPVEANGINFWIRNNGGANNLVVKDVGAATIATLTPGQAALFACDGNEWLLIIQA